ncbi:UDP-N-acetylmuramate dehydrogenase [Paraglaciecola aestuariivivens]
MYLAHLHSFGLASSALDCIRLSSIHTIQATLDSVKHKPFYILAEGSNTIFVEDYQGTIIKPEFKGKELSQTASHYQVKVGAGENWHEFVTWCLQQQINGLENLALIPGSVGAAPIQNIGAYGVEVEQFIQHVDYFDLVQQEHKQLTKSECQFGYRDSIFKGALANQALITAVTFEIPKQWQGVVHYGELQKLHNPSAQDLFNQVVKIRQSKLPDPKQIGNAGSFFKNPSIELLQYQQLQTAWPTMPHYPQPQGKVKIPAAWLIDQLGFKGKKVGGIACHPKQALVLTNDGHGTGAELLELARTIKNAVAAEFAIDLEHEVRLIGKNGPISL